MTNGIGVAIEKYNKVIESENEKQERNPKVQIGWHKELPNEIYHTSNGVSSSQLKVFLSKTPAHYQYKMAHKTPPTDSMKLGTAVHSLVLEPENFFNDIAVLPELNLRTKDGRETLEEFTKANKDKTVISKDQHEKSILMATSVENLIQASPVLSALMDDKIIESSVYWWSQINDTATGENYFELLKVRPDILCKSHSVLLDLKTCEDATFTGFRKSVEKYFYHMSAAMYLSGVNQCKPLLDELGHLAYNKFIFICVENKPPYLSAVYEASQDLLFIGRQHFELAFRRLAKARKDNWPGFSSDIILMEPSRFQNNHII